MFHIETIPDGDADAAAAEMYAAAREADGTVPNHTRAFCHRPEFLAAADGLLGAIRARMPGRRYRLVTVAAAAALRSTYCVVAHGSVLLRDGLSEETILAALDDPEDAGLDPADAAAMRFAALVARDAAAITAADVEALRRHGLDDGEITDITAAAAARCFFSKVLDALGATPDKAFQDLLPRVRDALIVGRPAEARSPTADTA